MTGLQCDHRFCTQCWTDYLTTKIMDEGMGQVREKEKKLLPGNRCFKVQLMISFYFRYFGLIRDHFVGSLQSLFRA